MGAQVRGTCRQWPQLSPVNSPSTTTSRAALAAAVTHLAFANRPAFASPFLVSRLWSSRSMQTRRCRGRGLRRALSASLDDFAAEDDEALVRRIEELTLDLRQQQGDSSGNESCSSSAPSPLPSSSEPPWLSLRLEADWPDQIVPASVEKNAGGVGLPLSLRMLKRKKRWEEGWFREAGESACCSVKRAFSSMVFMIRELHSYTLQMRELLFREDLRGILGRVQREINSSFVWLFQQIFSGTPALMLSVMLLLANFTVYSMGQLDATAIASPNPPAQQTLVETVVVDGNRQSHHDRSLIIKTFSSVGRAASVGGIGSGGGGKTRPVAGATGDERSDDGSHSYRTVVPEGISPAPATPNAEERSEGTTSREVASLPLPAARAENEAEAVWKAIQEEASRMKATMRDEALMEQETLLRLVAPVTAQLEADDYSEYLRTEIMYQQALSQDPENPLLLANFAQFFYLVLRDLDRAEYYFKRAVALQPADAEALSRYASFLWVAKKDMEAAEETYLAAIDADPSNTLHAANYAHFLWNTGGDDTCFPLDDDINEEAE